MTDGSPVERSDRAREFRREVRTDPGDGSLSRLEAVRDEQVRRWDVVTPSATLIGRPRRPDADLDENLRRLHDEQHPAMQGHSARMHRLDKARITQAFCNALDLTPWARDRALGIMVELDLTAFGSQRAVPKVALVVIRHVVDEERQRQLGLHDNEWVRDQPPEKLERLYERFESITDDPRYRDLMETHGFDTTSVNRLTRTLRDQLDEQNLYGAVLGRSPHQDPSLPAIRDQGTDERAKSSFASSTPNRDGADGAVW